MHREVSEAEAVERAGYLRENPNTHVKAICFLAYVVYLTLTDRLILYSFTLSLACLEQAILCIKTFLLFYFVHSIFVLRAFTSPC